MCGVRAVKMLGGWVDAGRRRAKLRNELTLALLRRSTSPSPSPPPPPNSCPNYEKRRKGSDTHSRGDTALPNLVLTLKWVCLPGLCPPPPSSSTSHLVVPRPAVQSCDVLSFAGLSLAFLVSCCRLDGVEGVVGGALSAVVACGEPAVVVRWRGCEERGGEEKMSILARRVGW